MPMKITVDNREQELLKHINQLVLFIPATPLLVEDVDEDDVELSEEPRVIPSFVFRLKCLNIK